MITDPGAKIVQGCQHHAAAVAQDMTMNRYRM
jgi:hypothetical protein